MKNNRLFSRSIKILLLFLLLFSGLLLSGNLKQAYTETGGDTKYEKLAEVLETFTFDTPGGPWDGSKDRMGTHDMYMCQIVEKDGQYTYEILNKYSAKPLP